MLKSIGHQSTTLHWSKNYPETKVYGLEIRFFQPGDYGTQIMSNESNLKYRIFESKEYLQSFCNDYLADLADEGFEFIIEPKGRGCWSITLTRYKTHRGNQIINSFVWGKVKSSYVPFFGMISSEFDVLDIPLSDRKDNRQFGWNGELPKDMTGNECLEFKTGFEKKYYTREQVLSGKCGINRSLEYIKLNIREK